MIPLLGAATYNVRRLNEVTTNYAPVVSAASTFTIRASIQPLSGDELIRAPEGLASDHGIKIYAPKSTPLRVSVAGGPRGDLIQFDGRWYEIGRQKPYPPNSPVPHNHYEAFAPASERPLPGGA